MALRALRRGLRALLVVAVGFAKGVALLYCCLSAYRIRLHSANTFGLIIHEFDPWFNYRAAEYLAANGVSKFFKWYDYMSWYPVGRPIGTTIYPGMQLASVGIWKLLQLVPEMRLSLLPKAIIDSMKQWGLEWLLDVLPDKGAGVTVGPMSLNDVCVMTPAWFGAFATFALYLLAAECSESTGAGIFAAAVMAIIPAHIMRSMAGEYDNECVAVFAFCLVLYLWCRSIRTPRSWPFAILAGLAYAFAASTWGGYIFINNLLALHAAYVVAIGRYSKGLYLAWTLFYVVGTMGAMQVPAIGWAPLRALEQMPSLLVFLVYQGMCVCDLFRARCGKTLSPWRFFVLRSAFFVVCGAVVAGVAYLLLRRGVFTPLGARIRGLFLEAVKTGNPLVDSVAEHQPASDQAYAAFLGDARFLAVAGLLFCWHQGTPAKSLAFLYAVVSYHYSLKMTRLMIICGPIVSMLAGYPAGIIGDWCLTQVLDLVAKPAPNARGRPAVCEPRSGGIGSVWRFLMRRLEPLLWPAELQDAGVLKCRFADRCPWIDRPCRVAIAVVVSYAMYRSLLPKSRVFMEHCSTLAVQFSNPRIVFQTKLQNGNDIIVDDYLQGYKWIKANTPEDSRIIAWWDYGYQITGVANRTSIADGNTWNHEHIATLGKILTSAEKRAHNAMRHLADYALVWAGGHGDDMGKSPHLARIGNSVFPDHCGDDDPMCTKFSFYQDGSPTPMMEQSFLYKAVNHNVRKGVQLNEKLFKEVHTTKYGLMRVFKVLNVDEESKRWIADPANRVCDAPGSWYCVGQYPPKLRPLIERRRNFAQLEDFNRLDGSTEKSAYTKAIESQREGKAKSEL